MSNKRSHSGAVRGDVSPGKVWATVRLDSEQALYLIRHVAETIVYGKNIYIEPHWGRKNIDGLYRIDIWSE